MKTTESRRASSNVNADKALETGKENGESKANLTSSPATPSEGAETEKTNIKVATVLLKTARGKSYDVDALNKAIADTLSNAGRLKSNANLTKVDLAGDGIFDGKAVALLAKAGTITKETAAKINAVRKLREAVEALMAK